MKSLRFTTYAALFLEVSILACIPGIALAADDAATTGEALAVPVFESIDQNGVDLITGMLRIQSPILSRGVGMHVERVGLQWTGRGWVHVEDPTIWRKDDVYTVTAFGKSHEFKDRDHNYAEKKPINGASLSCSIYEPENVASYCIFTNKDGDVLEFYGRVTPQAAYPPNIGQATFSWGNLGMMGVQQSSGDRHSRTWGNPWETNGEPNYYLQTKLLRLGGITALNSQTLTINTPNHNNQDSDEHYLRPKNTIQTITDDNGSVWAYTINDDREMTLINPPGTGASISIEYDANHNVTKVTTPDGSWLYAYTTSGDYGTTIITDPLAGKTYVKYHRDKGYVTEFKDPLNRLTLYAYDSGDRLYKVTYPEGNALEFEYDARGNVIRRTAISKPGSGIAPVSEYASYAATCTNTVLCNQPLTVTDAKGGVTELEYAPTTVQNYYMRGPGTLLTRDYGTTKPTRP